LTSFQQAIAYRITTILNIPLTFIWVFILYALWRAAFSQRDLIAGYTWADMRTYVLLAYGINALVGWRVGSMMMGAIRTGEILRELVRPLNYCGTQLAVAVGFTITEGLISLIFTLLLGIFVLDIQPPATPDMALLFILSVASLLPLTSPPGTAMLVAVHIFMNGEGCLNDRTASIGPRAGWIG